MRLLCLALLVAAVAAEPVRYDGYQTLRIQPKGEVQTAFVNSLAERLEDKVDVWAQVPDQHTDFMVPPRFVSGIKELLQSRDVDFEVLIDDVQALIDNQFDSEPHTSAAFDYSSYHTFDEIQDWVSEMASTYSSASEFVIATSTQGQQIKALKLSTGFGKKSIYWQGGIHAREWISPATVMYVTNQLLQDPSHLDLFDYYIVPSLNADGYSYTWSNDRMWRKTRSSNSGSICVGTDPNRNYDAHWGGLGASTSPCSDTYRGSSANSEPEVEGTTSYLTSLNKDFVGFIDFHSYSQLWLYPYSYAQRTSGDYSAQSNAAKSAVDALQAEHGTSYTHGPSAQTLYAASGCSVDWGYDVLGATYSYVVELRDTGRYGFLLPENQILPTGEETFEAVKAHLDYIYANV